MTKPLSVGDAVMLGDLLPGMPTPWHDDSQREAEKGELGHIVGISEDIEGAVTFQVKFRLPDYNIADAMGTFYYEELVRREV